MTPGTGKPLLPLNWSHDLLVLYCMVIVPIHVSKVRPTLSSPEFAAMEISRGVLTPTLGLVQGCYFPPCCATIPAPSTQTTAKKKAVRSSVASLSLTASPREFSRRVFQATIKVGGSRKKYHPVVPPFDFRTLSGLPRPYRANRSFVKAFWMWRSVRVN